MTNQRAIILLSQMYLPAFDEEEKDAITKAIEALTAQEPVKPILDETGVFYCANCKKQPVGYKSFARDIFRHNLFCPKCGREVKWDG